MQASRIQGSSRALGMRFAPSGLAAGFFRREDTQVSHEESGAPHGRGLRLRPGAIDGLDRSVADGIWMSPEQRAILAREPPVVNQLWARNDLWSSVPTSQCSAQATALSLGFDNIRKSLRQRRGDHALHSLSEVAGNRPGRKDLVCARDECRIAYTDEVPLGPPNAKFIKAPGIKDVWQVSRPAGAPESIVDSPRGARGVLIPSVRHSDEYISRAIASHWARVGPNWRSERFSQC